MAKRILITSGPTREPIDPVRYISNYSTGVFGYLIAEKARDKGYEVCLISGPVAIKQPGGMEFVKVETADQMKEQVFDRIGNVDCLIMAAAVSDFKPDKMEKQKIKKKTHLVLGLKKNTDILKEIKPGEIPVKIGFALETGEAVINGRKKLEEKRLDMVIVNTRTVSNDPFGEGKKDYLVIEKNGNVEEYKDIEKSQMAEKIVEKAGILMK